MSLEAQTFKDYEAILIDGGSTDNTFDVLKDFPKVKVLHDVPPQGPVKAVNKGISAMRGEYFNQLNSDCRLAPTMYEECLDVLERNRNLGMVYTGWYRIDDSGKRLGGAWQPKKFNRNLLLEGNFIDATSMVIPKVRFDVVGLFDERCPWNMDWVMAVKISSAFPIAFLDKPLFDYRIHEGQITQIKSASEHEKVLKIVRSYYSFDVRLKASLKGIARKVLR